MSEAQPKENLSPKIDKRRNNPGNPMMRKGWAGGPGRPKKILTAQELMERQIRTDLRAAAKHDSPEAYRFLLETMRNPDAGLQHRLSAATQILDRGWGKPTNQTEVKIDVYEKMSDVELIKLITGRELDPDEVAQARAHLNNSDGMTIDHEPSAESDDA